MCLHASVFLDFIYLFFAAIYWHVEYLGSQLCQSFCGFIDFHFFNGKFKLFKLLIFLKMKFMDMVQKFKRYKERVHSDKYSPSHPSLLAQGKPGSPTAHILGRGTPSTGKCSFTQTPFFPCNFYSSFSFYFKFSLSKVS